MTLNKMKKKKEKWKNTDVFKLKNELLNNVNVTSVTIL